MSNMNDFLVTDLVDDHEAADVMSLRAAALRAEYKNTETITATKQLVDNDCPFQLITASGANRDVELAVEAITNHATVIYNNGASNSVVVKDDSGATTFGTLAVGEWCLAIPMGGVAWKVIVSNAIAGAPFIDSTAIIRGSADATKLLRLEVDGFTTATTRVLTPPNYDGTIATLAGTETLTNKRVDPRVGSTTSSATPSINTDSYDAYSITALAADITSMTTNLSGTPVNFQKLLIRIKDNGTARAITWGASFEAKGVALPTTTVISKVLTVGFIYDTVTSKWGCVASAQEV